MDGCSLATFVGLCDEVGTMETVGLSEGTPLGFPEGENEGTALALGLAEAEGAEDPDGLELGSPDGTTDGA